jgi:hypothetical protein
MEPANDAIAMKANEIRAAQIPARSAPAYTTAFGAFKEWLW